MLYPYQIIAGLNQRDQNLLSSYMNVKKLVLWSSSGNVTYKINDQTETTTDNRSYFDYTDSPDIIYSLVLTNLSDPKAVVYIDFLAEVKEELEIENDEITRLVYVFDGGNADGQ